MKKLPFFPYALFLFSGFSVFCHQPIATPPMVTQVTAAAQQPSGGYTGPGTGFAVVELFTSEGCNSCPPADAILARIDTAYPHVYVLGFHVDYWNRLGWKDIYSSAAYTQRQENYGRIFHLNSVYTPEDVVNGEKEIVGGEEKGLRSLIEAELDKAAGKSILLQATHDGNKVRVSYHLSNPGSDQLQVALVQSHGESQVQAGENKGRHLAHVNIVRDFQTAPSGDAGIVTLQIPTGLRAADCQVIAFLQKNGDAQQTITGAAGTSIR